MPAIQFIFNINNNSTKNIYINNILNNKIFILFYFKTYEHIIIIHILVM
ncbi:hypothetical protein CHRYSEOSP005_28540 [Chryseobacterium sp. Alg-005]